MKKTIFSHLPQNIQSRYNKDFSKSFIQELKTELAKIVLLDKEYVNVLMSLIIEDRRYKTYYSTTVKTLTDFILALSLEDVNTKDLDNAVKQSKLLYKDFVNNIQEEMIKDETREMAYEFMMNDLEDRVPDYDWLRSIAKWRILQREQESNINLDF